MVMAYLLMIASKLEHRACPITRLLVACITMIRRWIYLTKCRCNVSKKMHMSLYKDVILNIYIKRKKIYNQKRKGSCMISSTLLNANVDFKNSRQAKQNVLLQERMHVDNLGKRIERSALIYPCVATYFSKLSSRQNNQLAHNHQRGASTKMTKRKKKHLNMDSSRARVLDKGERFDNLTLYKMGFD